MKNILNIINKTFLNEFSGFFSKPSFFGKIYSNDNNEKLIIDRSTYNRLINKTNEGYSDGEEIINIINEPILLAFINEIYEKSDSIWREDRNYYRSVIITELGIISLFSEETTGYEKKPDDPIPMIWGGFDYVELLKLDQYVLRFHEKGGTSFDDIPLIRFGTKDKYSGELLVKLIREINQYVSKKINENTKIQEKNENEIINYIDNFKYQNALTLLDDYSKKFNINNVKSKEASFYYINKTIALEKSGENNQALFTINRMIELCDKSNITSPNAHKVKGDILLKEGEIIKAINNYAYSEENYKEENKKKEISIKKDELYIELKNNFINLPYEKRKLIFISNDIYNTASTELILIKKDKIPKGISFPIGHPHINEVYTCHPLKRNFYLPLKDFQLDLFYDRVNELTYLLQCLGATRIEISSSNNNSTNHLKNQDSKTSGEVDYKFSNLKLEAENNLSSINNKDSRIKIEKVQTFTPSKSPYIPDNLIWYKTDLSWQRLAEQRLTGNIEQHEETISSIQNEIISSQEIKNINGELKILLPKINIEYNQTKEININSKSSFELVVAVKFENKELLSLISPKEKNSNFNESSKKYKEDLLFMLEDDGVIDEIERKILNRKIQKYGLSEKEAIQIENQLMLNNYSNNELLYIEEINDIKNEGDVTEIELLILDRYAKKYNIKQADQEKINNIFL